VIRWGKRAQGRKRGSERECLIKHHCPQLTFPVGKLLGERYIPECLKYIIYL
jgi:hypothetical protein